MTCIRFPRPLAALRSCGCTDSPDDGYRSRCIQESMSQSARADTAPALACCSQQGCRWTRLSSLQATCGSWGDARRCLEASGTGNRPLITGRAAGGKWGVARRAGAWSARWATAGCRLPPRGRLPRPGGSPAGPGQTHEQDLRTPYHTQYTLDRLHVLDVDCECVVYDLIRREASRSWVGCRILKPWTSRMILTPAAAAHIPRRSQRNTWC